MMTEVSFFYVNFHFKTKEFILLYTARKKVQWGSCSILENLLWQKKVVYKEKCL